MEYRDWLIAVAWCAAPLIACIAIGGVAIIWDDMRRARR